MVSSVENYSDKGESNRLRQRGEYVGVY